ncbi:MAG: S8 family serine peptidase, partial [Clostridia bacterium]|nr:S8 family serine peptidase [Clostridia bacterium]MBQ8588393.1 S8 family serine peptidase [Clostridia bacterium]
SFGTDYEDSSVTNLYAEALVNARKAGVSLITSNGNSARGYNEDTPRTDRPDYAAAGTPCGYETTTAVASANNTYMVSEYYALVSLDGTEYRAYTAHEDNPFTEAFEGVEYLEYEYCGLGYPDDFANVNVEGKIALVKRGVIPFTDKAKNAKAAGAVGLIIYNTSEELFACAEALDMPAAVVKLSTGEALAGREDKKLVCKGKTTAKEENTSPGEISTFSSWSMDSSLQLKPEITAPGGAIYSAAPDNKYETISGTSMSAPHMAGVSALSRQYYRTNPYLEQFNGKTGEDLVLLLENIAMNSADIIRHKSGVPYSPRVQGAGLVNMQGIIESPVLLYGDSGKAKLSLGEGLTDVLDIKFDIVNISKEPVTFDNISVEALTDGYTEGEQGYIVDESVYIPVASQSVPENVTVAPGETYTFSATVNLDKEFLAANSEIFTNGFYIDGYVILDTDDSSVRASIPFTGFYGDWGKAPIFDSTIYDEGGCYLTDPTIVGETGTYVAGAILRNGMAQLIAVLGKNPVSPDIVDKKYIAISPNAGILLDVLFTNFRAVDDFKFSLENSDGEQIFTKEVSNVLSKFTYVGYVFPKEATQSLEEGEYNIVVEASVAGDAQGTDTLTIP